MPGDSPFFRHPHCDGHSQIEEIDRLLGLETAPMIISVNLQPARSRGPRETILRRCKPQRELQQQDAESPLMIDESRFQASSVVKALTTAEFRPLKPYRFEP